MNVPTPESQWRRELFQRNQQNVEAWRRKMRCVRAVESVGECGDYPDLRNQDQMDGWLCIALKWIGVKNRLAQLQNVADPDTSDGVR